MFSHDEHRTRWFLAVIGIGAVTALLTLEFITEEGAVNALDVVLEVSELVLTLTAAAGLTLLFSRMQSQHEEKLALIRDLAASHTDGEGWRLQLRMHLDGLGVAIGQQLQQWKFTDAEAEVALLMLKGCSHKEISLLRGTSEATVRQQARAAYEKSGTKSRAGFCAFFLEDLLPESLGKRGTNHSTHESSMVASN